MTDPSSTPSAPLSWRSRILRSLPIRIIFALMVVLGPFILVNVLLHKVLPDDSLFELKNGASLATLLATYWAYVHYVEKRPVSELALRGALTETAYGLTLGLLLFTATIGVIAYAGAYQVTGFNGWNALWALVPGFVVGAFFEEIMFRGVIFRMLQDRLGSTMALLLSALFFGVVHINNAGATLFSSLAIALEAGLMLGAAYMLTGRLWLCVSIHFAWNISQGGIYSIPVSGHVTRGVLNSHMAGPDWLTGGAFGAEASVVALALCLLVGVLMIFAAWKLNRFVPAPWARKST